MNLDVINGLFNNLKENNIQVSKNDNLNNIYECDAGLLQKDIQSKGKLLKDKQNQDIETLKYAISEYLKDKKSRDLPKLMKYAKVFNVEEILNNYLEVIM